MIVYATRRLLVMIPLLLGASLLVFVIVDTTSDPVAEQVAVLQMASSDPVPAETIAGLEKKWYQDRSMPERYWLWLTGVGGRGDVGILQGEWGPSTRANYDIGGEIASGFAVTLRLVLVATLMAIGLAIFTGVVSAVRQYSRLDYTLTFVGFLALAMPTFWLAQLLQQGGIAVNGFFGDNPIQTRRDSSIDAENLAFFPWLGDVAGHLILPTLALMLTGYAATSRYQRSAMLEVLGSDYIRLARAKGVRNRTVMRRHALRTALIPVATFAPLGAAFALSGSIVVEQVFDWEGLGMFLLEALQRPVDPYAVMGYLLITGVIVLIAVLISDLLYGVLDPRIRYE
ncbi:MAG: ABC transporter permease [Stackebrandtia sp.]